MSARSFKIDFDTAELIKVQIEKQGFTTYGKRAIQSFQVDVDTIRRLVARGMITEQESKLFFNRILTGLVKHICDRNRLVVVNELKRKSAVAPGSVKKPA